MRGLLAAAVVLLLLAAPARAQLVVSGDGGKAVGTYDPCQAPPTGANKGDPFVFGLAFWPGGKISQWGEVYNATSGLPGLNPCLTNETVINTSDNTETNYRDYLSSQGVIFATYMVKVDSIAAVRQTRAEIDQIWRQVLSNYPDSAVLSVIAFRGQNRSEAQYVRSNDPAQTEGIGIVNQLSLLVSWDRGKFNGFQWYNQGPCDTCGGLRSDVCIETQYEPTYQKYPMSACATSFDTCKCNDGLNCPSNNCTTTIYMGHRGSDKSGRSLKTGFQIEQINRFSVTSWFWKLLDGAWNVLGNSGIAEVEGGSSSAPVVLGGDTDAALASGQAQQEKQGQPLANSG